MSDINSRCFRVAEGITGTRYLLPADQPAEESLATYKRDAEVFVTIRKPRNIGQHRLLFALLRKVRENSDRWADEECLLHDLKLATGLYTTHTNLLTGEIYPRAESISFAAMPQQRFEEWFNKALATLAEYLGTDPEILLAEASA